MFTRLNSRPMTTVLALAILGISACGGQHEGVIGKSKKSARSSAEGVESQGAAPIDGGSLSLDMPAGHAQFANVTTIEITVSSILNLPNGIICQDSNPRRCFDQTGKELPAVPELGIKSDAGALMKRRLAYKAGEKVVMNNIPSGSALISINMLDKQNTSLFSGSGYTQVQKGQTASAVVYVSPTPGKGSVNITIQPDTSGNQVPLICRSDLACDPRVPAIK